VPTQRYILTDIGRVHAWTKRACLVRLDELDADFSEITTFKTRRAAERVVKRHRKAGCYLRVQRIPCRPVRSKSPTLPPNGKRLAASPKNGSAPFRNNDGLPEHATNTEEIRLTRFVDDLLCALCELCEKWKDLLIANPEIVEPAQRHRANPRFRRGSNADYNNDPQQHQGNCVPGFHYSVNNSFPARGVRHV
jgi:hypothetical protein